MRVGPLRGEAPRAGAVRGVAHFAVHGRQVRWRLLDRLLVQRRSVGVDVALQRLQAGLRSGSKLVTRKKRARVPLAPGAPSGPRTPSRSCRCPSPSRTSCCSRRSLRATEKQGALRTAPTRPQRTQPQPVCQPGPGSAARARAAAGQRVGLHKRQALQLRCVRHLWRSMRRVWLVVWRRARQPGLVLSGPRQLALCQTVKRIRDRIRDSLRSPDFFLSNKKPYAALPPVRHSLPLQPKRSVHRLVTHGLCCAAAAGA